MRLRLYENHRFVLYAPFYAAYAIGAYSAEGLTVERSRSPGAGLAEQAPLDGAVEVLWAGPMRVMKHHDENPGSALICFAEIVCRDPLSIVDCRPNPEFRLAELTSKRFATVSEVPTPWLCLKEDFRQAGVDPEGLDCVVHSSMTEIWRLCAIAGSRRRSFLNPSSKRLWPLRLVISGTPQARAAAPLTRPLSRHGTCSLAPRAAIVHGQGNVRTQQWMNEQSAPEIAAAIGAFFPALDRSVLERARPLPDAASVAGAIPRFPRTVSIVSAEASFPEDPSAG